MEWHEITVQTTEEATEMISNFMHELGAVGLTIEDSSINFKKMDTSLGQFAQFPLNDLPIGRAVIKGYFENNTSIEKVLEELRLRISDLLTFDIDTGNPVLSVSRVDDEDWANTWKQYFKPFAITNRIVVKPIWETYNPQEHEIVIELDPGMAFGTGTHPTTSMCVRLLEQRLRGNEQVIDIGTGSGILAIAAVKCGASHVLALDLDPVSVTGATYNVAHNQLENKVTVMHSDLLQVITHPLSSQEGILGITLPVQVIVANILAEVIVTFTSQVFALLQPGGLYMTSGIIQEKADIVIQSLVSEGFEIIEQLQDGDWIALCARKPETLISNQNAS